MNTKIVIIITTTFLAFLISASAGCINTENGNSPFGLQTGSTNHAISGEFVIKLATVSNTGGVEYTHNIASWNILDASSGTVLKSGTIDEVGVISHIYDGQNIIFECSFDRVWPEYELSIFTPIGVKADNQMSEPTYSAIFYMKRNIPYSYYITKDNVARFLSIPNKWGVDSFGSLAKFSQSDLNDYYIILDITALGGSKFEWLRDYEMNSRKVKGAAIGHTVVEFESYQGGNDAGSRRYLSVVPSKPDTFDIMVKRNDGTPIGYIRADVDVTDNKFDIIELCVQPAWGRQLYEKIQAEIISVDSEKVEEVMSSF